MKFALNSAICLLLALSFIFTQDELPATHRSKMNSYCMGCHDCEEPSPEDPCLLECPRHGGKFFGKHTLDEGPDIVILDQLQNIYSGVVFQHNLHAAMSEMSGGCDLCHHYSKADEPVPPCRECHALQGGDITILRPSLKAAYHRQCLNCHREWSHETDCIICHAVSDNPPGTASKHDATDIMGIPHPKIVAEKKYVYTTDYPQLPIVTFHHADHVDLFGEKCVDCHRGDNCKHCHENGEIKSKPSRNQDHEAMKTCCICHVAACNEKDKCSFCHREEELPPFNHLTSVGWDLKGQHNQLNCQSCHGPVDKFITPSPTCTACHIHWEVGVFDHSVTGLELNDEHIDFECENCHIDEDFSAPPDCENCHDSEDIYYPDYTPGDEVD